MMFDHPETANRNLPEPAFAPPLLERLGALSSLMVHDMANHLCIISGNATFAELVLKDPEKLETAIKGIVQASNATANFLSRAGELRRGLSDGVLAGNLAELPECWKLLEKTHPGWRLQALEGLEGKVKVPIKWVAYGLDCLIRESGVDEGELTVEGVYREKTEQSSTAPEAEANRPRHLRFTLRYRAAAPISIKDVRSAYANLGFLASFELNRSLGGKIDTSTVRDSEQQILMQVPYVWGTGV